MDTNNLTKQEYRLDQGKSAIKLLQEYCVKHLNSKPIFQENSAKKGEGVDITVVINGKSFGNGRSFSLETSCELAAKATLTQLLGAEITVDEPIIIKPAVPVEARAEQECNQHSHPEEAAQLNAVSQLQIYLSAVAQATIQPTYTFTKLVNEIFHCDLQIEINTKKYVTSGEGKSKVSAKKEACFCLLRIIFPSCKTITEIATAIQEAARAEKSVRKRKSSEKSSTESNNDRESSKTDSSNTCSDLSQIHKKAALNGGKTDIARHMANVLSNAHSFGISCPPNVHLRVAEAEDAVAIFELIKELAEYEKEPDSVEIDANTIRRDGWESSNPLFYVFLAEVSGDMLHQDLNRVIWSSKVNGLVVGMALFFPIYSTWQGASLRLEDLIVQERYRGIGIGGSLLKAVAAVAHSAGMQRCEWTCLDWNTPSLEFYKSIGGKVLPEWRVVRMDKKALNDYVGEMRTVCDNNENVIVSSTPAWSIAFHEANKVGNEGDKVLTDFTAVKNQDDQGGFCQPEKLANFVAKQQHDLVDNTNSPEKENRICKVWLKNEFLNVPTVCNGCNRLHAIPVAIVDLYNDPTFQSLSSNCRSVILKKIETQLSKKLKTEETS